MSTTLRSAQVYLWRNDKGQQIGDVVCGPCMEAPGVRETYASDPTEEINPERDGFDELVTRTDARTRLEYRVWIRRVTCSACEALVYEAVQP